MASSLTVSHIVAGYAAVRVLDDVSLNVGAGETVALLGRSKVPFVSQGMLRLTGDRLLEQKRGADAVKVFEAMARSYPLSYAWIGLGRALAAAGDPKHATDAYRKALTINQTAIEARERLDALQAAKDAARGH